MSNTSNFQSVPSSQVVDESSDGNNSSQHSNNESDSEESSLNEIKETTKNKDSVSFSGASRFDSNSNISSRRRRDAKSSNMNSDKGNYESEESKNVSHKKDSDAELKVKVKKEILSDDPHSPMSDINPPSFTTRSKQRKLERRKCQRAPSSASSAVDSDARKTKSEPILITIDSDSDDNVSVICSRPNRTARIRGEIFRQLSRINCRSAAKVTSYKDSDSSSSESGKVRRKRKNKVKVAKVSTDKRRKYLVKRITNKSHLKLRSSHPKKHIARVFSPKKTQRLKIKNLRKRFEKQKKETSGFKRQYPLKKSSQQVTSPVNKVRSIKSEFVSNVVACTSGISRRRVSSKNSSFKASEHASVDAEINSDKKQTNTSIAVNEATKSNSSTIEGGDIDSKSSKDLDEKVKSKSDSLPQSVGVRKRSTSKVCSVNVNDSKICDANASDSKVCTVNVSDSKICNININDSSKCKPVSESTKAVNEADKDTDIKSSTVTDSDKTNEHRENKIDPLPKKMDFGPADNYSKTQNCSRMENKNVVDNEKKTLISSKVTAGIKKKLKPVDKIIRRRGRPRLCDAKPKVIPVLTDIKKYQPFLQSTFCFDIAQRLSKCRECRIALYRNNRRMFNSYCRFMEYRKLCYNKSGAILIAGFSEPTEATPEHLNQWLPQIHDPPKDLNNETAKSLLEHIGDQFCDLIEQEKEALSLHIGHSKTITWKRIVQGVREMCDVCSTTIFNIHWVCPICGLAVCIDCYKVRKQGIVVEDDEEQPKDRDEYKWLLCTMKQPHEQEKLLMAQIIPGNALWTMRELLHNARKKWNIPSYCKCNPQAISAPDKHISTGICKQLMSFVSKTFPAVRTHFNAGGEANNVNNEINYDDLDVEVNDIALRWLEGTGVNSDSLKQIDDNFHSYEDFAILRGDLLQDLPRDESASESEQDFSSISLDEIIACVTKPQGSDEKEGSEKSVLKHFSQRYPQANSGRDPLPIRIYTNIESNLAFSNVPHSWFCNGRLLFLHKADHPDNLALFQEQWKRGQPILVKGVEEGLDMSLWHPDSFCRDFGEVKNDLVDCRTGAVLKNLPMKRFWEGFETFSKRMKDENGEYMLLKLKDWPPGEDFSEKLPTRFHDLMKGLPLPEYTHRDGILNLAGRLPSWFVRPDLGPKMYNAYGSALYPTKGTTNLHLDVSDAVNVMVYVGIPSDGNSHLHIQEALKAIDDGGCDSLMRHRVRGRSTKPGALWHIYNARDADKIREMLTKVAIERGEKLEAHHDPIHDQSW
ncbi:Lysine-specific demethylase 3A, partial [Stegodyphus mimosarum]